MGAGTLPGGGRRHAAIPTHSVTPAVIQPRMRRRFLNSRDSSAVITLGATRNSLAHSNGIIDETRYTCTCSQRAAASPRPPIATVAAFTARTTSRQ